MDNKNKKVSATVWSSKLVDDWMRDHAEGVFHKENPWLDGQVGLKRAGLSFEYTKDEIEELTKCTNDVIYFTNNFGYCLHGSKGYLPITLRDYQEEMLNSYFNNRFTICMASRQCGKCSIGSKLYLQQNKNNFYEYIEDVYYKRSKDIISRIKYHLLKIYRKTNIDIILSLIEKMESYEYRNLNLDENDITKKIIDTVDIFNEGIQVLSYDGYHPITHIHRTQPYHIYELLLENGDRLQCADNHIIFCEGFEQKFVKDLTKDDFVMTKTGLSGIKSISKSRHKVSMYDITVDSKDHSYYTNDILSHNTVTAALFLLHSAIFNVDRNIGIAANKLVTAIEIMDKLKEIMNYLPFYMKPGIKVYNQTMIVFENGCRIIAQATTKRSFIGFTIHELLIDEFAHVEPSVLNEFYENIMPTVSSMEDSKIIITSTPNGYNKFYDIYQGAVDGTNSYHPIRVDWWQVPGRDEKWKEKTIADCGGEDEFMRQFGNSFLSTGNTLLSPDSLAKLQKGRIRYKRKELPELERFWEDEYVDLLFHPDFDVNDFKRSDKRWVISVDLSEGGGGDNSILNIFNLRMKDKSNIKDIDDPDKDIKKQDYFQLVQVGRFKSNITTLEKLAKLLYIIVMKVIGPDNVRVVCEYNAFGNAFMELMQNVFGDKNEFDMSTILRFFHSDDAKVRKYGLKVKADNKPILCITLKGMIANDNIVVTDEDTVSEFEVFSKSGNSWKASRDHDDLAMSTVDVTAIFDHPYFDVMMEEVMGFEENNDISKLYESKIDDKYRSLYDNYMNLNNIYKTDSDYMNNGFNGYFGNKGIY